VKVGVWCAVSARRVAVPVFFKERYVQVILGQCFPALTEEERLWLVSARLSYFPHYTNTYAGFDQCLGEQNYQQWYLASMFTRSQSVIFFPSAVI
jgi:hypothetical protein